MLNFDPELVEAASNVVGAEYAKPALGLLGFVTMLVASECFKLASRLSLSIAKVAGQKASSVVSGAASFCRPKPGPICLAVLKSLEGKNPVLKGEGGLTLEVSGVRVVFARDSFTVLSIELAGSNEVLNRRLTATEIRLIGARAKELRKELCFYDDEIEKMRILEQFSA